MEKKILPKYIYHWLDSIALDHWIQGDCYRIGEDLSLATHSFTIQDVILLVNILIIKFDLKCNIIKIKNTEQFVIYIKVESIKKINSISNT
jgi:hypothetical protein